jgi:cytochrome c oxidase cbb3-type subunit 4
MDINDMRSGVTVLSLILFVGIVAWTWQRSRKAAFDEAAQLPFLDDGSKGELS